MEMLPHCEDVPRLVIGSVDFWTSTVSYSEVKKGRAAQTRSDVSKRVQPETNLLRSAADTK